MTPASYLARLALEATIIPSLLVIVLILAAVL